jgi:hypothetical protein
MRHNLTKDGIAFPAPAFSLPFDPYVQRAWAALLRALVPLCAGYAPAMWAGCARVAASGAG